MLFGNLSFPDNNLKSCILERVAGRCPAINTGSERKSRDFLQRFIFKG